MIGVFKVAQDMHVVFNILVGGSATLYRRSPLPTKGVIPQARLHARSRLRRSSLVWRRPSVTGLRFVQGLVRRNNRAQRTPLSERIRAHDRTHAQEPEPFMRDSLKPTRVDTPHLLSQPRYSDPSPRGVGVGHRSESHEGPVRDLAKGVTRLGRSRFLCQAATPKGRLIPR